MRACGPAHPRSRGVDIKVLSNKSAFEGSSPLTRGRRRTRYIELLRCRLIPAHAGSTSSAPTTRVPSPAHPRSRGVDPPIPRVYPIKYGSSPLTRGRHRHATRRVHPRRLIPAHAGSTTCAPSRTP
ncbi:hypothetical protein HMPREF0058_1579 [Actinomyces urogenitalis DSM 15434]|nr:hypothetical protein HMPREF0058_1579 [Actinomyces urogenitalis DSM 15434]